MKEAIHLFLLLGLTLLLLTGATCPHPDQDSSRDIPGKTLDTFRQALQHRKYITAYDCLSENTRSRYSKSQFQLILEVVIFGRLLKRLLITWDVAGIKYDDHKAIVTLRHPKYHSYQKDFIFFYENDDWRVDITMARLLGVPQEDEDNLLSRPKHKKQSQKTSKHTPERTLSLFRKALQKGKYTRAYKCLSENTRFRYPQNQFQLMLELTIFGRLLRNLLINWDVVNVKYDNHKAIVTFRHYKHLSYQKDFIFLQEEKGWRIDITMAQLLGVPQEDEDRFFLPRKKKESR